ncbi:unnamed protein product, partial [Echinostoma caproni]|uniref:Nuclear pore complex protein n=1 Tax=Echinostoma caproni TaxID=27848 RepID=A0A183B4I0_9TREM
DAFADWFRQVHANRPVPPPESNATSYGARGFAQRLQAEEAKKAYEARVERWRHELRLDTEVAAEKLLQLLTYPSPGWLVDTDEVIEKSTNCATATATTHGDGELVSPVRDDDDTEEVDQLEQIGAVDATGDYDGRLHGLRKPDGTDAFSALSDLGENTEARRLQMQVLRETCLTETCFLLVRLYQTAGMHEQCVELTNLVASEQYGLHKCTIENILRLGWSVSPKCLPGLVQKTAHGKAEELVPLLLDSDLRETGVPWISDHRKSDQLEANGLVVQLVRLRNIAIPQADEDLGTNQGGPRLFRLALTDGRTTISALDTDNHEGLSMDTPPGTKIRLLGTIPISMGFLILRKDRFQVLGGNVPDLIREWTMTKQAKVTGRLKSGEGGPPPFVPFGSKEASVLVQTESRFLQSLRRNRGQSGGM